MKWPQLGPTWLVIGAVALVVCWAESAPSLGEAASEQAETRTVAAEVNLHASDAPGFKVAFAEQGEAEEEVSPGPLRRQAEECAGGPVLNPGTRGVSSPLFQTKAVPIKTASPRPL
jgi:hypothetical protein